VKVHVVTFILHFDQFEKKLIPAEFHIVYNVNPHIQVIFRGAQSENTGNTGIAGHKPNIPAGQYGACSGMPQLIDHFVDRRILLDISVAGGDVRFRLIVVIVAHEIFNGIFGKQLFEFIIELRREGLIRGDDQRRFLNPGNDMGHGKGLAGPGHSQKDIVALSGKQVTA